MASCCPTSRSEQDLPWVRPPPPAPPPSPRWQSSLSVYQAREASSYSQCLLPPKHSSHSQTLALPANVSRPGHLPLLYSGWEGLMDDDRTRRSFWTGGWPNTLATNGGQAALPGHLVSSRRRRKGPLGGKRKHTASPKALLVPVVQKFHTGPYVEHLLCARPYVWCFSVLVHPFNNLRRQVTLLCLFYI